MFNHKEHKLIYSTILSVERLDSWIKLSTQVLYCKGRWVISNYILADLTTLHGCKRGNLTLLSRIGQASLTPIKMWEYLDTWISCSVSVQNSGLEPFYLTASGQSKCLVLRIRSRIIIAILKYNPAIPHYDISKLFVNKMIIWCLIQIFIVELCLWNNFFEIPVKNLFNEYIS